MIKSFSRKPLVFRNYWDWINWTWFFAAGSVSRKLELRSKVLLFFSCLILIKLLHLHDPSFPFCKAIFLTSVLGNTSHQYFRKVILIWKSDGIFSFNFSSSKEQISNRFHFISSFQSTQALAGKWQNKDPSLIISTIFLPSWLGLEFTANYWDKDKQR